MKHSLKPFVVCFPVLFLCFASIVAQPAQWQCLGPDSLPAIGGDSSGFLYFTQGIGRTSCIRFHPFYNGVTNKTVYIGTPRGGLWRSYNGEDHWQEMNTSQLPNIGITDLAFHPVDTAHLYIATGDPDNGLNPWEPARGTEDTQSRGIFESFDGGKTWTSTPLGTWHDEQGKPKPTFWNFPSEKVMRKIYIHLMHPEIMISVLFIINEQTHRQQGFIYRSADSGKNWFVVFTSKEDGFQDIETMPGNPDVMYVSGRYLYKSTDAGTSWHKATSENFPADSLVARCKAAVCASDSSLLYALFIIGRSGKLYISRNEGTTFELAMQGNGSPSWRTALAVDPMDKDNVFYSGGNSVSRFSFNGNKWSNAPTKEDLHNDIHELAFSPDGKKLFVSSDGGVYLADTPRAGASWKYVSNGIGNAMVWRLGTSQTNPDHLIAGLQDCGTLIYNKKSEVKNKSISVAYSTKWSIIRGGDGAESFFDYTNDSILYHNDGQNNVFARSDNGGKRWSFITPGGQQGDYVKPALLDPVDPNIVYVGFHDIYKSTDRGKTWKIISDFSSLGKAKNERVSLIAVAPSNHNIIYAAFYQPVWSDSLRGKVFRTDNGGVSWKDITPGLTGAKWTSVNALAVNQEDADEVYVGFRGGWNFKVMHSTNGGADGSWEDYSEDLPKEADVNSIVIDKRKKGSIYIGTHVGVYKRKKNRSTWSPFMDGSPAAFPHVRVTDLEINYTSSELFAATMGRGIWKTALPEEKKKKKKKKV